MDAKNLIISPVKIEERKNLDIRAGDTVKVFLKIKEKDKIRLQVFEGLVLAVKHGKQAGGTFTVRKVASGVGVERIFPIYSPAIDKIEIVKRSRVRQAKLYHIRNKAVKEIKRQMRNIRRLPDVVSLDEEEVEDTKPEETDSTESENEQGINETQEKQEISEEQTEQDKKED